MSLVRCSRPSRGLWAALLVQTTAGTLDTLLYPICLSFPICERGLMSGLTSWGSVELTRLIGGASLMAGVLTTDSFSGVDWIQVRADLRTWG